MRGLNDFINESLLDDEENLINSDDLSEIPHTGIKYIDKKVDEMNSKMKMPLIYKYADEFIELSKKFAEEFKDMDLYNFLPTNLIKGIYSISGTSDNFKNNRFNPLNIIDEIDTFRSAINFIIKIQNSSIKSIKEFAKSQVFLNSTYLGKTSKNKYGENNTLLSWEFYSGYEDMDFIELEKDLKRLRASKGKSKIDVILRDTSDSKIIDIIFYK